MKAFKVLILFNLLWILDIVDSLLKDTCPNLIIVLFSALIIIYGIYIFICECRYIDNLILKGDTNEK